MSIYLEKGRGWKYNFIQNGRRFQKGYYRTKKEAKEAEAKKREKLKNPATETQTPTDMVFFDLVNRRLDHLEAYNSVKHYRDTRYMAKRWTARWGEMMCSDILRDDIQDFIFLRRKTSHFTANKEIRYLRALFNFGLKKGWITNNPTTNIPFLPVEKRINHVPSPEDIEKVISVAKPEVQEYLWTIRDTMGRMSEINRLTWNDVDLVEKTVTLYTRKKRGGSLTPRKVPMTDRLYKILLHRFKEKDKKNPWVFWHTYTSSKTKEKVTGPYQERKRIMKTLCKKAGVKYFRFHALRHSSASVMDNNNVSIGAIQRILGHENRTTTEIYLHSIGSSERDAINVYEHASKKSLSNPLSTQKEGVVESL